MASWQSFKVGAFEKMLGLGMHSESQSVVSEVRLDVGISVASALDGRQTVKMR